MKSTKRQQQKEETKKRIIEAAYTVYADKGFSATTSDIAKEINVSHGTIFAHFSTRDDLLIYLLADFGSIVCSRLHELTRESKSIADVLKAHLNAISEYEAFYQRLIAENRLLPSEVRHTFVGIQSTIAFHFNQVIEVEKEGNQVKALPTYFLFNTWVGLIHYYLQNDDIFAPDSSVINRYGDEWIDHFLVLIKK